MFKLIVISPETTVANEHQTIQRLVDAGLQDFHLRKPGFSVEDMILFLSGLPEASLRHVVLHSHLSLINEFPLRGIHCTGSGRDEFYALEDAPVQKSISVHGFCEAALVNDTFAYAFLSPVFDSISKPGYQQGYQFDALRNFLDRPLPTDFIALGGVSLQNLPECKSLGFNGAALLGSIWGSSDPVAQFERFVSIAQGL